MGTGAREIGMGVLCGQKGVAEGGTEVGLRWLVGLRTNKEVTVSVKSVLAFGGG